MISQVSGQLTRKDMDMIEIMTPAGIAYELTIPLSTLETLPDTGQSVRLFTSLVVKEDLWQLFGFASYYERRVFDRVRTANGVGPALAIGMLSTLTANRLVRAISEKDIAALQSVPRVGRKKAERIILDLADKIDDLLADTDSSARPVGRGGDEAIQGLISLGYTIGDAEKAVRIALDDPLITSASELIKAALAQLSQR